jgi:putative oxidoreductase
VENIVLYVGRVLFGGYFIFNAFNHFAIVKMMTGYAQSKGVPSAGAAVVGSGVLLLAGGISLVFNVYSHIGLAALVLFFLPVTFMMHAFWKVEDTGARMGETVNFAKNMALLGAVLVMLAQAV